VSILIFALSSLSVLLPLLLIIAFRPAYLLAKAESNSATRFTMKTLTETSLTAIFATLLAAAFLTIVHAANSAAGALPVPQGQVITCSSNDMRRNYCAADVRGGAQLVRQRSDAPCIFNHTWGFINGRGIWVDRGCRADFQVGGSGWGGWDNGYNIYCASDDGRRNVCPTDTRGGVQLVRQISGSPCDFGRTWGYNHRGIWVDRGCRADFRIGGGGGGGNGGGWQPGGGGVQVITCSSDDMRRQNCRVDTRGGVRLVRQRSDADCVYGRTWGYDRGGIWVDRGCRADFEVGKIRY
jgi:hypothetical protein